MPTIQAEELQYLCNLSPKCPQVISTINLDNNRPFFKKFFRGINRDPINPESREEYNKEVFKVIGVDKCLGNLQKIDLKTSIKYNYANGDPCLIVLRQVVSEDLTKHFYSLGPSYCGCGTRNVSTLHLGPKEFNPGVNQIDSYEGRKQVWILDEKVTQEQVTALLPELIFADKILQQFAPNVHKNCLTVFSVISQIILK